MEAAVEDEDPADAAVEGIVVVAATLVVVVVTEVTGATNPVHGLPVDTNVAVSVAFDFVGTVYTKLRALPVFHFEN